jgi:hypothetical protein
MAYALVNSYQHVELSDHCVEQPAVGQLRPAEIDDARNLVAPDPFSKSPRTLLSSRTRTWMRSGFVRHVLTIPQPP